ncbi:hypothetical protein CERZMDRAFT_37343 [Cercospora zeae-maydis SCOH1-5]|uniref:FAD/NAD(P)-binding domain-containing protein n=1 Tax=Cercospora zeae-maydis SCOH1-5 TaxID=717836 RepID=A0A6A6FL60_9PEZI|nr:hypothetical protein CERZMDRAFT_37343 [Cercospora zeae-maydis SCOH1-5]
MGSTEQHGDVDVIHADVLVIGAGFTGVTAIHRLRKEGYSVKCFEQGAGFGGVWYWNRYPGARVDSEWPFYQLDIPELVDTWTFSERYPGDEEIRRYFEHADKVLDLSSDTYFNAEVIEAKRDEGTNLWTIKTKQGHVASGKYLLLGTGLLHRTYMPHFPGLEKYKGALCHSAEWLKDFNAKGKKIGLIGAGATAVQITEQLGKVADELVVFVRRPSYCLPMRQRKLHEMEQIQLKPYLPLLLKASRDSPSGFPATGLSGERLAVPDEEAEAQLERAWILGGFHFNLGSYRDTFIKPEANELHYQFWRKKILERLTDPEKQKIMAPEKQPYYIGTKRTPLEQDYYDVLNQPNVKVHDLIAAPLKEFTEKGIITVDGKEYEFDAVILATGFDALSGSLTKLGLKSKDGVDLKDIWANGISTYMGLAISGFPNAFMAYSPQAPNTHANATTILQCQVEIIVDMIKKAEAEGFTSIEATPEGEAEWKAVIDETSKQTLFPLTDSWWNGSNIPGKKTEFTTFLPGCAIYERSCRDTLKDWKGWNVARAK